MYMANIWEEKVLNAFRSITATAPAAVYAGLLLENPKGDNTGTEVTYSGYKRQAITFSEPALSPDEYGTGKVGMKSTNTIVFPRLEAPSGTAVGIGYFDSEAGGNIWAYSVIAEGLTLNADEEPTIPVGKAMLISSGDFTSNFATNVLNMLRGTSIQGFRTFIGLASGDPTKSGTEFTGSNYSRQEVIFSEPEQQRASEQALMSNSNEVIFNSPISNWGSWSHIVYYNAESGGNPVIVIPLKDSGGSPVSKEIKVGYTPKADVGALKIGVN